MTTLSYDSLSDVPDGLSESVKEGEDGKFYIKVAAADKITEFRDNNVKLSQERDNLLAVVSKYEGVTGVTLDQLEDGGLDSFAKALSSLRETKKKVDDGALVENTSLEEAAAKRVTEVTSDYRAQLAEMAKDRDAHKDRALKAEDRANGMQVENAIRFAASDPDVAMLEGAVDLVMERAKRIFRVEEGKIIPKSPDGTTLYGPNGVDPMSPKEWLVKQRETSTFLFKGSRGGGAEGGSETVAGKITQKELDAMSPQQRMNWYRKNQARAA